MKACFGDFLPFSIRGVLSRVPRALRFDTPKGQGPPSSQTWRMAAHQGQRPPSHETCFHTLLSGSPALHLRKLGPCCAFSLFSWPNTTRNHGNAFLGVIFFLQESAPHSRTFVFSQHLPRIPLKFVVHHLLCLEVFVLRSGLVLPDSNVRRTLCPRDMVHARVCNVSSRVGAEPGFCVSSCFL